jgi:hypothetical protein
MKKKWLVTPLGNGGIQDIRMRFRHFPGNLDLQIRSDRLCFYPKGAGQESPLGVTSRNRKNRPLSPIALQSNSAGNYVQSDIAALAWTENERLHGTERGTRTLKAGITLPHAELLIQPKNDVRPEHVEGRGTWGFDGLSPNGKAGYLGVG